MLIILGVPGGDTRMLEKVDDLIFHQKCGGPAAHFPLWGRSLKVSSETHMNN